MKKFKLSEKLKGKIAALSAGTMTVAMSPAVAFAADASSTFNEIKGKLSAGIVGAGVVMIVWGAVNVGLAIKDGSSGNQLQQGLLWIVGGAIVGAAGAIFANIDLGL